MAISVHAKARNRSGIVVMTILLAGVAFNSAKGSVILAEQQDVQRLTNIAADPHFAPARDGGEIVRGVSDRSSDMSPLSTETSSSGNMPCANALSCPVRDSVMVGWRAEDNSLLHAQTNPGCLERPPERNRDL